MTTATPDTHPSDTYGVHSTRLLNDALSCLVDREFRRDITSTHGQSPSSNMSEEEVVRNRRLARFFHRAPLCSSVQQDTASREAVFETDEARVSDRSVLALIGPLNPRHKAALNDDSELIDWDVASTPRVRETSSIPVNLYHAGRGTPIADPDPWT